MGKNCRKLWTLNDYSKKSPQSYWRHLQKKKRIQQKQNKEKKLSIDEFLKKNENKNWRSCKKPLKNQATKLKAISNLKNALMKRIPTSCETCKRKNLMNINNLIIKLKWKKEKNVKLQSFPMLKKAQWKNVEHVPSICKWNKQCQSKRILKIHDRNKMTTKLTWKKAKNVEFQSFILLKRVMMKTRQTCSFNLELEICIKIIECECVTWRENNKHTSWMQS